MRGLIVMGLALAFAFMWSSSAAARPYAGQGHVTKFCGDRVCGFVEPEDWRRASHVKRVKKRSARSFTQTYPKRPKMARKAAKRLTHAVSSRAAKAKRDMRPATRIVAHPPGCPRRAFCGCGVSLKIFGERRRGLYLARNWFKFPRARPAPGMVAVRHGHVFAILKVLEPGVVLAFDPNSGGRQTRIWRRSLAGFTVVNPRGANVGKNRGAIDSGA